MGYKEQVAELESEIAMMKQKTYCAYCGKEYALDTDGAIIGEHIATCEKHPMRAVESELAAARAENDRVMTALLWVAGEDGRDVGMQYANELHNHINKRDAQTVREFDASRERLDAEYEQIMVKYKAAIAALHARPDDTGREERPAELIIYAPKSNVGIGTVDRTPIDNTMPDDVRRERVAAELFRRSRLVDNRTFDEDRDYWMGIAREVLCVADGGVR